MAPRKNSRHTFTEGVTDDSNRMFLTARVPFRYQPFADNVHHTVSTGDTLFRLAGSYYAGVDRPAGLWWVIADFQPEPILDPTLELAVGRVLVIPSLRTVQENVFSEDRRAEG